MDRMGEVVGSGPILCSMQSTDAGRLACQKGLIVNQYLALSALILGLGIVSACSAPRNNLGLTIAYGDKSRSPDAFDSSELEPLSVNAEPMLAWIAASSVDATTGEFPDFLRNRELPSLYEDADFALSYRMMDEQQKDVAVRKRPLLDAADRDRARKYHMITIVHLPSQTQYLAYATFADEDDGGNTLGWVEDRLGRVVSRIDDAFFNPLVRK